MASGIVTKKWKRCHRTPCYLIDPLVPASLQACRRQPLSDSCAEEQVRSAQLYASRSEDMLQAAAALVQDFGVSHVDINFGCPVRKITSRGGGAAIPLKPALFASLVRAAVAGSRGVPVTVKMRLGISPDMVRLLVLTPAGLCVATPQGSSMLITHCSRPAVLDHSCAQQPVAERPLRIHDTTASIAMTCTAFRCTAIC